MYKAQKGSQLKGKIYKKRTEIKAKSRKRISCVVGNDDTKPATLRKAVAKWKHYHKNVCASDKMYFLLYERGEVINKLPETDEDFIP